MQRSARIRDVFARVSTRRLDVSGSRRKPHVGGCAIAARISRRTSPIARKCANFETPDRGADRLNAPSSDASTRRRHRRSRHARATRTATSATPIRATETRRRTTCGAPIRSVGMSIRIRREHTTSAGECRVAALPIIDATRHAHRPGYRENAPRAMVDARPACLSPTSRTWNRRARKCRMPARALLRGQPCTDTPVRTCRRGQAGPENTKTASRAVFAESRRVASCRPADRRAGIAPVSARLLRAVRRSRRDPAAR